MHAILDVCHVILCGALRSAFAAIAVQNGAPAIHAKCVFCLDMSQQLIAHRTLQVNQAPAQQAFQVKMPAAVGLADILIDKRGLCVASVLAHGAIPAEFCELTVQRALTSCGGEFRRQRISQLVHRILAIRMPHEKGDQPLAPLCFIGAHMDHRLSY